MTQSLEQLAPQDPSEHNQPSVEAQISAMVDEAREWTPMLNADDLEATTGVPTPENIDRAVRDKIMGQVAGVEAALSEFSTAAHDEIDKGAVVSGADVARMDETVEAVETDRSVWKLSKQEREVLQAVANGKHVQIKPGENGEPENLSGLPDAIPDDIRNIMRRPMTEWYGQMADRHAVQEWARKKLLLNAAIGTPDTAQPQPAEQSQPEPGTNTAAEQPDTAAKKDNSSDQSTNVPAAEPAGTQGEPEPAATPGTDVVVRPEAQVAVPADTSAELVPTGDTANEMVPVTGNLQPGADEAAAQTPEPAIVEGVAVEAVPAPEPASTDAEAAAESTTPEAQTSRAERRERAAKMIGEAAVLWAGDSNWRKQVMKFARRSYRMARGVVTREGLAENRAKTREFLNVNYARSRDLLGKTATAADQNLGIATVRNGIREYRQGRAQTREQVGQVPELKAQVATLEQRLEEMQRRLDELTRGQNGENGTN